MMYWSWYLIRIRFPSAEHCMGIWCPGDVRTVDVHIRRLREKIASEPKYRNGAFISRLNKRSRPFYETKIIKCGLYLPFRNIRSTVHLTAS